MGDRIKKIRLTAKLTQQQFADRLGLSRNFIAVIETSDRRPSDRTITDICREFGVSLAWLRDGVEPMYVQRSMNEELAIMVNSLLAESDESFRKRLISALLELPDTCWPEFEKFIKKLSQNP